MTKKKLFCEISPLTYQISVWKCRGLKHLKNTVYIRKLAKQKQTEYLPIVVYKHNSLIRRKLGNVDMQLQENKANNLAIASPLLNGLCIHPKETFSFWKTIGNPNAKKGYKEGLTISKGNPSKGVGGGMCQMTNLIHWMVLHTDLTITERHHHDRFDLFPDYNRQVPFGVGTSILYNYIDYQVVNNTNQTYQLKIYTTDEYLCGEILSNQPQEFPYHIITKEECFVEEEDGVYRLGEVYRKKIDKKTGKCIEEKLIQKNHAKVMYDISFIQIKKSSTES